MSTNKYYDPFSVLKKSVDNEKKLFVEAEEASKKKAYIIKADSGERISINRSEFKIGTKKELCDYIVTDNKYVGRYHARIIIENGQAFFEDNNSTNKSYVNNQQASPNQRIVLNNGDEFKLANVLFKYVVE